MVCCDWVQRGQKVPTALACSIKCLYSLPNKPKSELPRTQATGTVVSFTSLIPGHGIPLQLRTLPTATGHYLALSFTITINNLIPDSKDLHPWLQASRAIRAT